MENLSKAFGEIEYPGQKEIAKIINLQLQEELIADMKM